MKNKLASSAHDTAVFLTKNKIVTFIIGYVMMFMVLLLVTYAVQPMYYRIMPGSWWIHYDATVAPADLGEDLTLTLERTQRVDFITFVGTRTIRDDAGRILYEGRVPSVASGLEFATAEGKTGIISIPVTADKIPQRPGMYVIETCIAFDVRDNDKQMCYTSNEFSYGL